MNILTKLVQKKTAIMEELGSPKEAASELITNILNCHIQVEDVQEVDDEPINYRSLYMVAGLVLALLLSVFFLFIEPLFGIAEIFITSIVGGFYLGKNFQEVRKAKKVIWLAMLAIVTLPIATPVLLILLGALVALVLLIIGFIRGGFVLGVGLFVSGGYLIWEGFSLLSHGVGVFLLGFGSGLTMLGGAVLVCLVTLIFSYWSRSPCLLQNYLSINENFSIMEKAT